MENRVKQLKAESIAITDNFISSLILFVICGISATCMYFWSPSMIQFSIFYFAGVFAIIIAVLKMISAKMYNKKYNDLSVLVYDGDDEKMEKYVKILDDPKTTEEEYGKIMEDIISESHQEINESIYDYLKNIVKTNKIINKIWRYGLFFIAASIIIMLFV